MLPTESQERDRSHLVASVLMANWVLWLKHPQRPHFPMCIKWVGSDIAGVEEISVIDFRHAHSCVENTGMQENTCGRDLYATRWDD